MLASVFPLLNNILPYNIFGKRYMNWFIEYMTYAIRMRKSNGIQRDDCLDYLIQLQESKNLGLVNVAALGFVIFLDGFETSGSVLANALYRLAKNTKCQEKLRDELKGSDTWTADELNQMQYLDNVFNGN